MPGFQVSVRSNSADVIAELLAIGRDHAPVAMAKALTFTAERVKTEIENQIGSVFDRPTAYTKRSLYLRTAVPARLSALVKIKDVGKGTPAVQYLMAEVESGPREHKPFEKILIAKGLMPSTMFAVPGAKAVLDGSGNMRSALIVRILSAVGAGAKFAGKKLRGKKPAVVTEFFLAPVGGRSAPGIYQRKGRLALPILIFVKKPSYRQRLDFFGVAERVASQQFEAILIKQMAREAKL